MSERLLVRFDETAADGIRCPAHPLTIARERIASGQVCEPDRHEWTELEGYYWRECRRCGLTDVTLADIGEPVETPNAGSGMEDIK